MSDALKKIADRLSQRSRLSAEDCAAIMALPMTRRQYSPAAHLVREGEARRPNCTFLLEGLAFRQKLTVDGARQIISVHLPGDFVDLQHLFLEVADHNVQALTRIDAVEIQRERLQQVILSHPAIGLAMWVEGLIEASICREWVLNVGRRDARARIAHILCEFAVRMQEAGIATGDSYLLPMTQEQLGDAVGLTNVHVNRTLRTLIADGLVKFDRRQVSILNWEGIRAIGEFNPLYLHAEREQSDMRFAHVNEVR